MHPTKHRNMYIPLYTYTYTPGYICIYHRVSKYVYPTIYTYIPPRIEILLTIPPVSQKPFLKIFARIGHGMHQISFNRMRKMKEFCAVVFEKDEKFLNSSQAEVYRSPNVRTRV